jgi:hypothetical protein
LRPPPEAEVVDACEVRMMTSAERDELATKEVVVEGRAALNDLQRDLGVEDEIADAEGRTETALPERPEHLVAARDAFLRAHFHGVSHHDD